MTSGVVRRLSPEEEELAAKRQDLAQLEAELVDRELALAGLKAELAAFEGLYLRRVGILYAELDEWTARLAELKVKKIATPEADSEAAAARTQATESYSAAHSEAAEAQPVTLSPELKKLYRDSERKFARGDRVQLTAPYREQKLANRELATIERIEGDGNLKLRTDSGREVEFNARQHPHLDYSYAVTSHGSRARPQSTC